MVQFNVRSIFSAWFFVHHMTNSCRCHIIYNIYIVVQCKENLFYWILLIFFRIINWCPDRMQYRIFILVNILHVSFSLFSSTWDIAPSLLCIIISITLTIVVDLLFSALIQVLCQSIHSFYQRDAALSFLTRHICSLRIHKNSLETENHHGIYKFDFIFWYKNTICLLPIF